jgi:hypothetical protein
MHHYTQCMHHCICIIMSLILKHLHHAVCTAFAIISACSTILFYSFFILFYSKSTLFSTRTLRKND